MLSLPTEILQAVGVQLPRSELKALSSTTHRMRDALLPIIMKDMNVDSMQKLQDLAMSGERVWGLIRNLNVTLNIEFFDAWAVESGTSLASVLSKAQHVQSLTFQASNSPYDTPWNRLSVADPSSRGLSLGVESLVDVLPTFDRLTHLELQTVSTESIRTLIARAPHLRSLAVILPDGLSELEMARLLDALERVPHLKELEISMADWEAADVSGQANYAKETLRRVAQVLPHLETLDLRTRTYDIVDGILTWKCVNAEKLCLDDFVSVISMFHDLRVLRLPLRVAKGDALQPSATIAKLSPHLTHVSWMNCVDFNCALDEYIITRSQTDCSDVTVIRMEPPKEPQPAPNPAHPTLSRRRGLSLFDSMLEKFANPSKPSVVSDIAITFSVLMVIGSTMLSPFLILFG